MTAWTSETVKQVRVHLRLTWNDKDAIENALTDYENEYGQDAILELLNNLQCLDAYLIKIQASQETNEGSVSSLSVDGQGSVTYATQLSRESGTLKLYSDLKNRVLEELKRVGLGRIATVGTSRLHRG